MLPRTLLLLPVSIACFSNAATISYPNAHAFLKQFEAGTEGKDYFEQTAQPTHTARQGQPAYLFGVTYRTHTGDGGGRVFVLQTSPTGSVEVSAISPSFEIYQDANYGKGYVETVEPQSIDSFSIQFNQETTFGPVVSEYRFALIGGDWRVTRLTMSDPQPNGPDSAITTRYIADFVKGRIAQEKLRNDKVISRRQRSYTFPTFLLSKFVPFDERYVVK